MVYVQGMLLWDFDYGHLPLSSTGSEYTVQTWLTEGVRLYEAVQKGQGGWSHQKQR